MKIYFLLASFAVLLGAGIGFVAPNPAEAATYNLYVHPGATSSLNCGWHDGPCPNNPGGPALDWGNSGSATVYWRSYGRCGVSCTSVGTGTIALTFPFCTETHVTVRNLGGAAQGGDIIYTHTGSNQSGQGFYISGNNSGSGAWMATGVGYTLNVGSENGPCNNGTYYPAAHLHQKQGTGWTRNTTRYPNPPGSGTYPITSVGYQQVARG